MSQQNTYCVTHRKAKLVKSNFKLNAFTKKIPLLSKLQTKYSIYTVKQKRVKQLCLNVLKAFFIGNFKLDK